MWHGLCFFLILVRGHRGLSISFCPKNETLDARLATACSAGATIALQFETTSFSLTRPSVEDDYQPPHLSVHLFSLVTLFSYSTVTGS